MESLRSLFQKLIQCHFSEEQQPLEDFFRAKNIRFKNEMMDDVLTPAFLFLPFLPCSHPNQTYLSLSLLPLSLSILWRSLTNPFPQSATLLAAAGLEVSDDDSGDDAMAGAARGSADEDEESIDEDFQADSDSDVAEEYDSAHESSGGDDEEEEDGVDDDEDEDVDMDDADGEEEDDNNRPAKKVRK